LISWCGALMSHVLQWMQLVMEEEEEEEEASHSQHI
jgi:hypothetical protein